MSLTAEDAGTTTGGKTTPFPTECDLVMKGGITSGIVYPLAVVEISKAFRLRSIGGTSAGAIAAAAAAAAELGRQRRADGVLGASHDGFAELGALPDHLCKPSDDGKGNKLLAFFKPQAALRPLFDTLTATLATGGTVGRTWAAVATLIRHYKAAALLGALVGTLPLWLMRGDATTLASVWLAALGLVCALAAVLWFALRDVAIALPSNRFGVCSGMPDDDEKSKDECLTPWLTQYYNSLSGQKEANASAKDDMDRMKPLTFGDLKAASIDLQMMTTCLSQGRPFRLPFRDDEQVRDNNQFLYNVEEFRKLFPKEVVDWMVARERRYAGGASGAFAGVDFRGYRSLPAPDDLPVVVAVRMSLSFPILLSAIPLYSCDFHRAAEGRKAPERCWFTDGGVGSNFPIHFFDAPLPTRPTFGLDLGQVDAEADLRVVFPKDNGDARLPYWRRFASGPGFGSLAAFLGRVVSVEKEWNHEALSHMPGYRDRIGLIRLTKQEGGLNLTMPKERIAQLTEYGKQAGIEFVRRFGGSQTSHGIAPAPAMNWENHQLVRLRLFLASSSEMLGALKASVEGPALQATMQYQRFFGPGDYGPATYRFTGRSNLAVDTTTGLYATQAGLAAAEFEQLLMTAKLLADTTTVNNTSTTGTVDAARLHPGYGAPKPTPELRLRPRI